MAVIPSCDDCGAETAYQVGNVQTGEQRFVCPEHYGGAATAAPAEATPENCELCEVEPTRAVVTIPDSGVRMVLGERCFALQGHVAYLRLSSEDRETLDAMAREQAGLSGDKKPAAKRKRQAPSREFTAVGAQPSPDPED